MDSIELGKRKNRENGIDENDTQSTAITIVQSLPETNKLTRSLSNPEMVKKIQQNCLRQKALKIEGGGTMKVFGDALNPSIPYKTFLLSIKDTAEWVVKEMLEKYGLKHEDPQNYCLLQIVIPSHDQMIKEVILHDKECPLNICLNHAHKNEGSIMFKVIKCPMEYIETRKRLRVQESNLNIIQTPSIQDRTINDYFPIFVEVNNDGTDLPTPRVFKIHPSITYVGRDARAGLTKQYFYIDGLGINDDHCIIQNKNGIVTLIPHGEMWLNRKLISTSFVLQHGAIICFGRNSTFRYYDPLVVQKIKPLLTNTKQQTDDKVGIHGSLPALSMNGRNSNELEVSHSQQKKILLNNGADSGTKINVLPGLLEVPAETEIRFLHAVFDNYPLNNIQFRLSPVYTLYMALRYRLSLHGNSNVSHIQKQEKILSLLYHIDDMINKKIEECQKHGGYLVYWMANTSEFLYFLKQDRHISKISYDIQDHLAGYIHRSFYYFLNLVQNELDKYLLALTNPRDDHIAFEENSSANEKLSERRWIKLDRNLNKYHQPTLDDILAILSSIMDLLRKCRVNAALTIQIFSQIFLYINTWLFNRIVCCPELKLCSYFWGEKLSFRLKLICHWAKEQGLELPSECHLTKVNQLCLLLQSPKRDMYDVQQLISNNTFQINSIQIIQILNNYILSRNEPEISSGFSQALLSAVYKNVDENLCREGFVIQLAEETDLNLPFVLPEDGYTCDNLRGIPQQLFEFIDPMSRLGLCRLFTNSRSMGMWTEFMQIPNIENSNKDSIQMITLTKQGNSLGLTIVSAKGESQQFQGIYIKGIVPDSAAENDGRLHPGDQILCVDKISLIDKTQEQATQVLRQCGPSVTLKILKDAANHQGLSALLATPSDNHSQPLTHFPTTSNPSLIPSSSHFLRNSNSHNRLLSQQEHGLIQPARSTHLLIDDNTNNYSLQQQQHRSNPNLFYPKHNLQSTDSIRSDNQKQSLCDRNFSAASSLIFRQDIPPNQNGYITRNHQIKTISRTKSAIAPKTLPKPNISIRAASVKLPKPTIDINNCLPKTSLSLHNRLTSSTRQSLTDEQESANLVNISELRVKRINGLLAKTDRTEHEEKELNNLKLEDEFDRRVEQYHCQTDQQEISSSLTNEFDEKLKRRLEQFEYEREIERAHAIRMLAKRETDIKARLHKDREREIRADRDMREFKSQRMSEEDQILEAKKEQARLLKHIRLPTSVDKDNQSSIRRDDFYSNRRLPPTQQQIDDKENLSGLITRTISFKDKFKVFCKPSG